MTADGSRSSAVPLQVVVVGAGVAGLAAADALTGAGAEVTVFEARDRVGGRLHSSSGVDLGATWFWPNEPLVEGLTRELGVGIFPQHMAGDALFERGGVQRMAGNPLDGPCSRFEDGAASFAHRLAARIPRGNLRLGHAVDAITVDGDGVAVGDARADAVVLALPPALAAERIRFDPPLPADVRETAERTVVWMGEMIKAVAIYDQPFWRADDLAGSAFSHDGPFREFHDHSGPGGSPAALFGFAPAAPHAHLEIDAIDAAFRDQLVRLFGARDPLTTYVVDWSRERFTTPERADVRASTHSYGAGVFQRPVHGRVHWASTETATAYAGHVEGAIHAGLAAARRILAA